MSFPSKYNWGTIVASASTLSNASNIGQLTRSFWQGSVLDDACYMCIIHYCTLMILMIHFCVNCTHVSHCLFMLSTFFSCTDWRWKKVVKDLSWKRYKYGCTSPYKYSSSSLQLLMNPALQICFFFSESTDIRRPTSFVFSKMQSVFIQTDRHFPELTT